MLESDVRNKARDWAKANGWLVYPFASPSNRSVPDRIYIKDSRVVFIEFKQPSQPGRPGGRLTKGQERKIKELRDAGAEVHVTDSVEDAKMILLGLL
jgi:hypothetical protein